MKYLERIVFSKFDHRNSKIIRILIYSKDSIFLQILKIKLLFIYPFFVKAKTNVVIIQANSNSELFLQAQFLYFKKFVFLLIGTRKLYRNLYFTFWLENYSIMFDVKIKHSISVMPCFARKRHWG